MLTVNDSPVLLAILVAQLEQRASAFRPSIFAALDATQHKDFDAVFLDVQMPGWKGWRAD